MKNSTQTIFDKPANQFISNSEAIKKLQDAAQMHVELSKKRVQLCELYSEMHSSQEKYSGGSLYIAFSQGSLQPGTTERDRFDSLTMQIEDLEDEIHDFKAKMYEVFERVGQA